MQTLIEIQNLSKLFPLKRNLFLQPSSYLKAVDNVNFEIFRHETLGLVGESGSGKSTLARLLLRLLEPDSGQILFDGNDILKSNSPQLHQLRKRMQIVFQSSLSSLNPRMLAKDIVSEPLLNYGISDESAFDKASKIFFQLGLIPEQLYRYPREFSGGERQRLNIARAIALNPDFLVLDEPTSELDVTVRLQILELLKKIRQKYKMTFLFISHDLGVINFISDRVAVMQQGKIVEIQEKAKLFKSPQSPYTKKLIQAVPKIKAK